MIFSAVIDLRDAEMNNSPEYGASLKRRKKQLGVGKIDVIVHYEQETLLDDVGLQLWSGCFLLADFLICNGGMVLNDKLIFEFGSGVGFVAILLDLIITEHNGAIVTDMNDKILEMLRLNLQSNRHLRIAIPQDQSKIRTKVRKLDWIKGFNPRRLDSFDLSDWSKGDCLQLQSNNVLFLAADVIYDDILTLHFFLQFSQMIQSDELLILSFEKRVNFSLPLMREVINGYDLFLFLIHDPSKRDTSIAEMVDQVIASTSSEALSSLGERSLSDCIELVRQRRLFGERVPVADIPQFVLSYERSEEMELWKVGIQREQKASTHEKKDQGRLL